MGAIAFVSWTIVPVGWIWIASQVSPTQFPNALAYLLCLTGIAGSIIAAAALLTRMAALHSRMTGQRTMQKRGALISTLAEEHAEERPTTLAEKLMIGSVVMAALSALVLFLFLTDSPLGSY